MAGDPIDAVIEQGRAQFADFDDRSAFVAAMAASLPELREALAAVPDGHRVVASLADNPDEAVEILKLRGTKLGTALGSYSARSRAAAAAPKPEPKGAEPDVADPDLDMKTYAARREQGIRAHRERKPATTDIFSEKISMDDYARVRAQQDRERLRAKRER